MTQVAIGPKKIAIRPRPPVGLGYQWIGKEEEELVIPPESSPGERPVLRLVSESETA